VSATKPRTRTAPHGADRHDLISGSGKSSLVFDTIAAESQRLITTAPIRSTSPPPTAVAGSQSNAARRPSPDVRALRQNKTLNEGAPTIPGYSMDGWQGRIFRGSGFFDPESR
jgi:hypothetical protein